MPPSIGWPARSTPRRSSVSTAAPRPPTMFSRRATPSRRTVFSRRATPSRRTVFSRRATPSRRTMSRRATPSHRTVFSRQTPHLSPVRVRHAVRDPDLSVGVLAGRSDRAGPRGRRVGGNRRTGTFIAGVGGSHRAPHHADSRRRQPGAGRSAWCGPAWLLRPGSRRNRLVRRDNRSTGAAGRRLRGGGDSPPRTRPAGPALRAAVGRWRARSSGRGRVGAHLSRVCRRGPGGARTTQRSADLRRRPRGVARRMARFSSVHHLVDHGARQRSPTRSSSRTQAERARGQPVVQHSARRRTTAYRRDPDRPRSSGTTAQVAIKVVGGQALSTWSCSATPAR